MRKVHVHDDGVICDSDDCALMKCRRAREKRARRLVFSVCLIAVIMSAVAIASDRRYGLVFLALFLILVPVMSDKMLSDRSHRIC
jgi:hypothetical protein